MRKEIKFKKWKVLLGAIFCIAMLAAFISFISTPDIYIRNVFTTIERIQIIGVIGTAYFSTLLFSLVKLLQKSYAILITDEFLIDNSKYESLGEIAWKDISSIRRYKKRNVELKLNQTLLANSNRNLLKRFLVLMHNWNNKSSILISSALLECSITELFEEMTKAHQNSKLV